MNIEVKLLLLLLDRRETGEEREREREGGGDRQGEIQLHFGFAEDYRALGIVIGVFMQLCRCRASLLSFVCSACN